MTMFYAWVKPANAIGSWADHTWVTTYDSRVQVLESPEAVIAANEHLWRCWGAFHPNGVSSTHPDGLLGSQDGVLKLSSCLVRSNADSVKVAAARGTVQAYGIEGVCHQVGNQALYSTATSSKAQLTFKGSRGYYKSILIYKQFGRRRSAWATKVRSCTGGGKGGSTARMPDHEDDFVARATRVLADRTDLLDQILAMRDEYQGELDAMGARADITPEEIDARHHVLVAEIAGILGHDRFVAIFDHEPDDEMNLVDPEIFAASRSGVADEEP